MPAMIVLGIDPGSRRCGYGVVAREGTRLRVVESGVIEPGELPLAGRLAVQIGAHYLQGDQGGSGVLLGGVPGVPRGRVSVIGAGIVGTAAVRMAVGLGAEVNVLDIDGARIGFPKTGDAPKWGLVRASNTGPILVMRFEAGTQAELEAMRAEVEGVVAEERAQVAG